MNYFFIFFILIALTTLLKLIFFNFKIIKKSKNLKFYYLNKLICYKLKLKSNKIRYKNISF